MVSITVTLRNQKQIERALRKFPEKSAREFGKAVKLSAQALAERTKLSKRTPADTGRMAASIHAKRIGVLAYAVRTGVDYALFVHEGTKPHFPPPKALAAWARTHGMPGAEFAIARAISKRGTKRRPFFEWAMKGGVLRIMDRIFSKALERVLK